MQFQTLPDISPDNKTGWIRSRAWVMSSGGWGLPLYENAYRKENGVWKISRLSGPFTMYSSWAGWGKDALNNTWPDKFNPAPDLPPSTIYLTYPAYYIAPFHYPNPVTGKVFKPEMDEVGAYAGPPGSAVQKKWRETGRLAMARSPSANPRRSECMKRWLRPAALAATMVLSLAGLGLATADTGRGPADVDSARMAKQAKDGTDWLHDGRAYDAQRYSPLTSDQRVQREPARHCLV